MNENVVGFPGHSVPTAAGEPVAEVVEYLEQMLEEALSGNLRAVAIAGVIADGTDARLTSAGFKHDAMEFRTLFFAISALMRLAERWADD